MSVGTTDYKTEVLNTKQIVSNAVILINGQYFALRQPDSGLSIDPPFDKCLQALALNPTNIDPSQVTTTIASYSFQLTDVQQAITALILGDGSFFANQDVEIWIGRSLSAVGLPGSMDFADYLKLPITQVQKIETNDNSYHFTSQESTQRLDRPIFAFSARIGVDILSGTTIITMQDSIAAFPSSGSVKIDSEFLSYAGLDLINNQLTGCIRGTLGTTPASHSALAPADFTQTVTDNPLNIILQLLVSGGGGSVYDVLSDGLAIDQSLIDISGIEALRDSLFSGVEFTLSFYGVTSALTTIETELLMPNNLRFSYNVTTGTLTLAVLDKAIFTEDENVIDDLSITKRPDWSIDTTKLYNQIQISWDWSEATQLFNQVTTTTDAVSVAQFGLQPPLVLEFRGVKAALGGAILIADYISHLLARLAYPIPQIQVNTQMDKSLQSIGDKTYMQSAQVPGTDGTMNFASDMEIISRSINFITGDVVFKLAFTSFSSFRSGYIAPSDSVLSFTSQSSLSVAAGRGTYYSKGWVMRLWNVNTQAYEADAPNTILSVVGDVITFAAGWATTLTPHHKIRFAGYDDVSDTQKRYCFVSDNGDNFNDGKPTYKVTY